MSIAMTLLKSGRVRLPVVLAVAAMALAAAPAARADQLHDARAELMRVRIMVERELRSRPEMLEAKTEWVTLRRDYAALRRSVVEALNNNAEYVSTRAQMWRTQDEIDAIQAHYRNGVAPVATLDKLARQVLEDRLKLAELERQTLERHADVLLAREAYLAAGKRLAQLHREIKEEIRTDPRFEAALQQVLELRGGRPRSPYAP